MAHSILISRIHNIKFLITINFHNHLAIKFQIFIRIIQIQDSMANSILISLISINRFLITYNTHNSQAIQLLIIIRITRI